MSQQVAQLTITLDSAGNVGVAGPIDQKLLAYGLLEVAREVIYDHNKKAESRIQLATPAAVPFIKPGA